MTYEEVITDLKKLANPNPKNLAGMARYGIKVDNAWCISMPNLRNLAKSLKKEPNRHELATKLWKSKIHEAQILAAFIDDPSLVTDDQMEDWVKDFESWDTCDQVCGDLFDKTALAYDKAYAWSERKEEFVKRAGFVLMAALAVHDKRANDEDFILFLEIIKREATDERNFVRKAVNWALRNIGKARNANLYHKSLEMAYKIREIDNKTAKWIAGDAIRELEKDYIKNRFTK
jgi:3-methyladenine DNA glycosylase AlkD